MVAETTVCPLRHVLLLLLLLLLSLLALVVADVVKFLASS